MIVIEGTTFILLYHYNYEVPQGLQDLMLIPYGYQSLHPNIRELHSWLVFVALSGGMHFPQFSCYYCESSLNKSKEMRTEAICSRLSSTRWEAIPPTQLAAVDEVYM